jgi:rhodanese-related sulfurtransferase
MSLPSGAGWRQITLCVIGGLLMAGLTAVASAAQQEMARYIETRQLADLMQKPASVLLLDIRGPEEFAISHLAGSRNISPLIESDQLAVRLRRTAPGKVVVVYCTIAARSSDFVVFAEDHLKRAGAREVYVLKGGILAWHNEGRPLVDRNGPTRFVHPHDNALVGQLLQPSLARWNQ